MDDTKSDHFIDEYCLSIYIDSRVDELLNSLKAAFSGILDGDQNDEKVEKI